MIKIEIWRDIENYGGLYKVSNKGIIKSLKRGKEKILKPSISTSGYLQVVLCNNAKTKSYFVHKLVASAFIENKNNYKEINHKDENKLNNNVNNLEWCTRKYNMNYGTIKKRISKSKKKKVIKLDKNCKILSIYNSIEEAARLNNASAPNIVACCKNKADICKGYKWQYLIN